MIHIISALLTTQSKTSHGFNEDDGPTMDPFANPLNIHWMSKDVGLEEESFCSGFAPTDVSFGPASKPAPGLNKPVGERTVCALLRKASREAAR